MTMAAQPIETLSGYLGKDREVRWTRERTCTVTRRNEVAEMNEEHEIMTTPREYLRLSLATHDRTPRGSVTSWHNLVVWDPDRQAVSQARLGRKGDLVEVTGRSETLRYQEANGTEREHRQFVVETFHILRHRRAPEIP